jgi:hypothetical protein
MRETIGHLFPAAFCAFISVIALVRWAGSETGSTSPVFLAFLPMCFVMMGFMTLRLQRELAELRRQVRDLEAKRS